mmetsp:Transcript_8750/g.28880  ORF Transcript_8750/g.28880 Transcript_8750/m.28880 type:complete len:271 (+) Transcript_8750:570-1382(+)
MGPRMLKAVRTLSALRTGTTAAMAGWKRGANMKPMPASSTHRATPSGPMSTATPRASRTSADPQRDDTDRLPCLATLAPAAAQRIEAPVEMFTDPIPSPPVPTMSTTFMPSLRCTLTDMFFMPLARPATSAEVSPLARRRTRKAEICAASPPVTTASSALMVCSSVRSVPLTRASITSCMLGAVAAAFTTLLAFSAPACCLEARTVPTDGGANPALRAMAAPGKETRAGAAALADDTRAEVEGAWALAVVAIAAGALTQIVEASLYLKGP